jgi:hypothetical protein
LQITSIYVFQAQLARVYANTTAQYNMISATFVAVLIILLVRGLQMEHTAAPPSDAGCRTDHFGSSTDRRTT